MDTHAALTSPFHRAWSGDPGTPIYDDLVAERALAPAGPPTPRQRGMFEPVISASFQRTLLSDPVQTHPYWALLKHPADAVEHDEVELTTAVYPRRPALPLALAER